MRVKIYFSFLIALGLFSTLTPVLAQVGPKTLQEIQLLLQEKSTRTPAERKIDSRLLQFVKEKRGQKMAAGVNLQPVKMDEDLKGNFKVELKADVSNNLLSRIEAMGGKIISSSVQFRSITVEVNSAAVEKIAALSEIKFIQPAPIPTLEGTNKKVPRTNAGINKTAFEARAERVKKMIEGYLEKAGEAAPMFFSGPVNSEGDKTHRAGDARNAYGYAGQGIRIGVLSDSYNSLGAASADVANGELPGPGNPLGNTTPVTVLQDITGGTDEGRAMVQIVHDLAPKAQLFFATAYNTPANFAANILALRSAPNNCDIIIDDVSYNNEPVFYDGPIAQAVNTVTASGALYFSSAGNSGSLAKNTSGAFEADFNDVGSPVFAGSTKTGSVYNFGTVASPVIGDSITTVGSFYALHWADAPGASNNDYDLFLIDSTGKVKASSTNLQSGAQDPFESFTGPTLVAGDRLVVFKTASAAIRAFHLNTSRGKLKYATNGQTHGHASAANAYCVAAAPAVSPGPFPAAFSTTSPVETFSSDGPRRIFYNADSTPVTAGNFLFGTNGGVVRAKPDITAADGVSTTLPPALNPFYGTSAAAPHAGAIAGLLKSAKPSLTPAQIRTILTTTAVDIESPGFDNVSGAGIIQAFQAMQAVMPAPMASVDLGTVTPVEGSFKNGNGIVEPGENANITVQLTNQSMVNATNVTGTLTTNTPGVTITQGNSNYGTINAGGNAVNATPFTFAVSSSVGCGAIINFVITAAYSGGSLSPQAFQFSITLGGQQSSGISSTLGNTPPAGTGYTVISGQQTGRLGRYSVPSTCAAPGDNPGLLVTTGARQFDAYTFTNNGATQCITVTLNNTNAANIFCAAYNNSGFVPASPSTNYVAQSGTTSNQPFSVNVPAGQKFTIVVSEVNSGGGVNTPYTLNITMAACAAGPACTPVDISTASIASGATGTPYTQSFAATGGSGNYSFNTTSNLPAGLSFSGNTLSGTPTQAGTFPITVTATDLAGCPAGTKSYTLVISGIPPASVTASVGTPQSAHVCTTYPTALQVTVRDASNNLLSGVNVIFTAPSSGASGTFAGGALTATVVTNASGIATAPNFTANTIDGSYAITASVVGVTPSASFVLTNTLFVVTSSADSGPNTLRDAVNNVCPGGVITFGAGITQINLTSGELLVNKPLTITGPGASSLTVSAGSLSRVLHVATASSSSVVNISGVTIRDGKLPASSSLGGAGILIEAGIVNINSCVISNNDASAMTSFSDGGGVYNASAGLVTIDQSSIINNVTDRLGGGIAQWGSARITITNSTISGNRGTGTTSGVGYGGGLFYNTLVTLTNCTVFGNTGVFGSNIFRNGTASVLTFKNSIIAGGILAGGSGPDIYSTTSGGALSADYNLIQSTSSAVITGTTTHNITGVSPILLPLANYGGATPTLLPQPGSPVINKGDSALTAGTDQRGSARVQAGVADMGAVEANYAISTSAGTPQTTPVLTPFPIALQAKVTENLNNIAGVPVFFKAPATGASGTFTNSTTADTATTNVSGIATSHTFTANNTVGSYNDSARIGSVFGFVTYTLTNSAVLPLTFSSVTASAINCAIKIEWKTLTEINTKDFAIEYSTDGVHYTSLSTLAAKGNSTSVETYNYTHVSTVEGVNYYRIKQTDKNGDFTYSNVVIVTNSCGKLPIVAYPNPVRNKLTVILPGTAKRTLTIFDVAGRRITQQSVSGGTYEINASSWVKGMYTLSINQEGEKAYVLKIIKD